MIYLLGFCIIFGVTGFALILEWLWRKYHYKLNEAQSAILLCTAIALTVLLTVAFLNWVVAASRAGGT